MLDPITMAAEGMLRERFRRKHCIFTGRATTAIYLALRALGATRGSVVVPAIVCPNPASAVVFAGLDPLFCDVRLSDYTLDPDRLRELLDQREDVRAVIAVHLYGYPARMDAIAALARARGIPVIEDVAQALGGAYGGRALGELGDISILGFGPNKIPGLDGGGALLTDDRALAREARALEFRVPELPEDAAAMQAAYRKLYYAVRDLRGFGVETTPLFRQFPAAFRRMYLHRAGRAMAGAVVDGLGGLDDDVAERRAKARIYREHLDGPRFRHPEIDFDEAAFWRYSVLFEGDAHALAERIRRSGIDASNWYPNIAPWYSEGGKLENADYVERHILNLWTDATLGHDEVLANCSTLRDLIED
jgi:dTDP-4-amino-4,6-dideoxygalactose transaminase